MNEFVIKRDDEPEMLTLERGGQKISFKKVPDAFAVRMKQGSALDEKTLNPAMAQATVGVSYVESDRRQGLDVFRVEQSEELDATMAALRDAASTEVVTHLYTVEDSVGAPVIPTGTLTIQFNPETGKAAREVILKQYGLKIVKDIDFLPGALIVELTSASNENPLKIALALQQMDEVLLAEPDLSLSPSFSYAPNDPYYPQQWHLNNRGDRDGLKPGADVKAEEAWEITKGSRDITICVIDNGFDLGHPELMASEKIVAPRDFAQNDNDPRPTGFANSHGTSCAGIAVAEENNIGVVGLAPNCSLMPIRFGRISDVDIVSYFEYAMNNKADVISCSWAAQTPYYPLSALQSGIIHKAATEGRNGKGCVILFAAGNESNPLRGSNVHQGFALHPDVIAVAASTSLDEHSHYSNYGSEIALCAPSDGAGGRGILTIARRGLGTYADGSYTSTFGGTSSATPLAAALAGLILSVNPDLTAAQVKQIMIETADKIDLQGGNYVKGHSQKYGYGRINAQRAVQRTRQLLQSTSVSPAIRSASLSKLDVVTEPKQAETIQAVTTLSDSPLRIVDIELSELAPTSMIPIPCVAVTTSFELSGEEAERAIASQSEFHAEIYLIDQKGKESQLVGRKMEHLGSQKDHHESTLLFPMPKPGRYEVRSQVVIALPSGKLTGVQSYPQFLTVE